MSLKSIVFEDKQTQLQTTSLITLFFQNTSVKIVEMVLSLELKNVMIGTQTMTILAFNAKTLLVNVKPISMENQSVCVETIKSTINLGMIHGSHVTMET